MRLPRSVHRWIGSTLVLAAFAFGLCRPLVCAVLEEDSAATCRPGRCCCPTAPGTEARLQRACPCGDPEEPAVAMAGSEPAETSPAVRFAGTAEGTRIMPPPSASPGPGHAETADPPPKALLS